MCHPRYCLTHILAFPPVSPTLLTLAHRPHFTLTVAPPTSSTLARNPRQHATNVNTLLTLVGLPRKHATYDTHVCTNSMPFLKLLGNILKLLVLRFQKEIQQFLLLAIIFKDFTFQAFLSIFIEVSKTAIEKLNLFRGNQSALFKRRLFFQK